MHTIAYLITQKINNQHNTMIFIVFLALELSRPHSYKKYVLYIIIIFEKEIIQLTVKTSKKVKINI